MKIAIYIAISANGMISNARNVPDWLSQEYGEGLVEICHDKKAVIMGKTTYNILAPDYLPLKDEGTTIVLTSKTEEKPANKTVVFTKQSPAEIITLLEEREHKEAVIIGGTQTISEFFNQGLVDEVLLVMEPVFFGKGLPLFGEAEFESRLKLKNWTKINPNSIQLHYEVLKQNYEKE